MTLALPNWSRASNGWMACFNPVPTYWGALPLRVDKFSPGFTPEQVATLKKAHEDALATLDAECAYLEENMHYQITPVRNLVTAQAGCGLLAAEYVSSHS